MMIMIMRQTKMIAIVMRTMNTRLIHDFRDQVTTFSVEVINRLLDDYDFYKNSFRHTKNQQRVQKSKPGMFKNNDYVCKRN